MRLVDKYRPKELRQMIGQGKIVRRVRAILGRKAFDRGAFWVEGDSGKGKTVLAECIARRLGALGSSKKTWSYIEIDGDKCSADTVRGLDDMTAAAGLFADQWRVFVVNEAHAMTARAVQAWLTLLERLPIRWLIVFTTTQNLDNLFGEFNHPFGSRVGRLKLTNQGLCDVIARFAYKIASREDLNGRPMADYSRLVKDCRNNIRMVLQRIDDLEMLEKTP